MIGDCNIKQNKNSIDLDIKVLDYLIFSSDSFRSMLEEDEMKKKQPHVFISSY